MYVKENKLLLMNHIDFLIITLTELIQCVCSTLDDNQQQIIYLSRPDI